METSETTAIDFQSINGACPATGRSASVCTDQTHVACYAGRAAFLRFERALEAMER